MSLKPSSLTDFLHKASSVLATVTGVLALVPETQDWKTFFIYLTAAVAGGGVSGSLFGKK